MSNYRTCRKCGQPNPLTDFDRNAACKQGRIWSCKTCRTKHRAGERTVYQKRYYQAHRAQCDERMRKYHQRNRVTRADVAKTQEAAMRLLGMTEEPPCP